MSVKDLANLSAKRAKRKMNRSPYYALAHLKLDHFILFGSPVLVANQIAGRRIGRSDPLARLYKTLTVQSDKTVISREETWPVHE